MGRMQKYFRGALPESARPFFTIALFIFFAKLLLEDVPWYSAAAYGAAVGGLLALTSVASGIAIKAAYGMFQRRALKQPALRPFVNRGYMVDRSRWSLNGLEQDVWLRIYWYDFHPRHPKKRALVVEAPVVEDFPATRPTERGLLCREGRVASYLDAGLRTLPETGAIERECARVVAAVKKYHLTSISPTQWMRLWGWIVEEESGEEDLRTGERRKAMFGLRVANRKSYRYRRP